jgi:hypothetical protein
LWGLQFTLELKGEVETWIYCLLFFYD